jgi:hypothetical protein
MATITTASALTVPACSAFLREAKSQARFPFGVGVSMAKRLMNFSSVI